MYDFICAAPQDYEALSQVVTIPASSTFYNVPMGDFNDDIDELPEIEVFTAVLQAPTDELSLGPNRIFTVDIIDTNGKHMCSISFWYMCFPL